MKEQEKDEILKALQLIKDICNSNHCDDCPFYEINSGNCNIHSKMPYDWNNKEPEEKEEKTWRAFN